MALLKPFTITTGEMHCHAVLIHCQRSHTWPLDYSSWGQSTVLCQEPFTVQLLECLKGLFTLTSSPCSCEVIHPSMTTMSVFMQLPVISAFICGVHCVLNAYKTSIPCFLRSTPGPMFHITNNQSFVSSIVI